MVKELFAGVSLFGIGLAVGILSTRQYFKKKYEEQYEKEINEDREIYKKEVQKAYESKDNLAKECRDMHAVLKKNNIEYKSEALEETMKKFDSENFSEPDSNYDYDLVPPPDEDPDNGEYFDGELEDGPAIIEPSQMTEPDYSRLIYNYYIQSDILEDEDGDILYDIDLIGGILMIDAMRQMTEGDRLYIKVPIMDAYIEVIIHEGEYLGD